MSMHIDPGEFLGVLEFPKSNIQDGRQYPMSLSRALSEALYGFVSCLV